MLNSKRYPTEHRIYQKDKSSKFLSDFRQFSTSLDLKVGYSYIQRTQNAINFKYIIILWEEYCCKHVLVRDNNLLLIWYSSLYVHSYRYF